jgi:hypothetical protein
MKRFGYLLRRFCTVPLVGLALVTTTSCDTWHEEDQTAPADYALSADGRTIVSSAPGKGLVLYDWRSRKERFLAPPGGYKSLFAPSFSVDGTKIAVLASDRPADSRGEVFGPAKLGVIDVASGKTTLLPVDGLLSFPSFRRDGKAILYVERSARVDESRLFVFDLDAQAAHPLMSGDVRFTNIYNALFTDDSVTFTGRNPQYPKGRAAIEALKKYDRDWPSLDPKYHPYYFNRWSLRYLLRAGSDPQILDIDLAREQLRTSGRVKSMQRSGGRDRLAYIDDFQLFAVEHGHTSPVTNEPNLLLSSERLSWNGSTAVARFGVKGRAFFNELAIVDLDTGQTTITDFVKSAYWPNVPRELKMHRVPFIQAGR